MKKTAVAIGLAGAMGIGGLVAPFASATAGLHAKINNTKPKVGDTVTMKFSGARKSEQYVCIETLTHGKAAPTQAYSDIPSFHYVNSNSKGKGTCQEAFVTFTNTISGKSHSCPPTKKDKKSGWGCGLAVADPKHRTEFIVAKFKY